MQITITLSEDEPTPDYLTQFLSSALKDNRNTIECINKTPETQSAKKPRPKFVTREKIRKILLETQWTNIDGVSVDQRGNILVPLKVFQGRCSDFASRQNVNNVLFGRAGKADGIISGMNNVTVLPAAEKWTCRVLRIASSEKPTFEIVSSTPNKDTLLEKCRSQNIESVPNSWTDEQNKRFVAEVDFLMSNGWININTACKELGGSRGKYNTWVAKFGHPTMEETEVIPETPSESTSETQSDAETHTETPSENMSEEEREAALDRIFGKYSQTS